MPSNSGESSTIAGVEVRSSPSTLNLKARLGEAVQEPAIMGLFVMFYAFLPMVFMAFIASGQDIPKHFGRYFFGSLGVLLVYFFAAHRLNRAHVSVDSNGIAF